MALARRPLVRVLLLHMRRAAQMLHVAPVFLLALATMSHAEIIRAEFVAPTDRYAHGVLGDDIEWGALKLYLTGGKTRLLTLPETRVFEDLTPRLFDMDGDGDLEVIVVESSNRQGARLSIYDETGLVSATPYIGSAFRWLAPVGAADLDGDGFVEVAYIDRPHLAKTLRIWRFKAGRLSEVAELSGLTNHRIGQDFITGGIRHCAEGPEMITVDSGWRRVIATRFDGSEVSARDLGPFSKELLAKRLACK